jgi:imidazolonepropionase-like amidohydrolase
MIKRVAVLSLAVASVSAAQSSTPLPSQTFLIRNVRVFDGTRVLDANSVLVERDTIRRVGTDVATPPGVPVVNGAGMTLLPGLIDAHTHTSVEPQLGQALLFGVTTEMGMDDPPSLVQRVKAAEARGENRDGADLFSAGWVATVPHGHGTEYGSPNPTLTRPDEAAAFVDARIAEGSDYIKIIDEDGSSIAQPIPTLSVPTIKALVDAAHARHKLVVAHISTYRAALDVINAGVDGLAHLFADREPDPSFGATLAAHHVFVIPTMVIQETMTGRASGASLVDDPDLAPFLTPDAKRNLKSVFTAVPIPSPLRLEYTNSAVRMALAAGVPILAGTDAPNPGTWYGAAMHRELELLVQAGLTPEQALSGATALPARIFHLDDRGTIAPGKRADLLLVRGDPTTDIRATRAIVGIWKLGSAVDRGALRDRWAAAFAEHAKTLIPSGSESGVIATFDDSTTGTRFGRGWRVVTDTPSTTASISIVPGGANGTRFSLGFSGTLSTTSRAPNAALVFSPLEPGKPVALANLSSHVGIRFWAKGDGRTYRIILWTASYPPVIQTFVAGREWREYSFPFASFHGNDGFGVVYIVFGAAADPGPFHLQLDEIGLYQ